MLKKAYDDYEAGAYSPKLLKPTDVDEVSTQNIRLHTVCVHVCVHVCTFVYRIYTVHGNFHQEKIFTNFSNVHVYM